MSRDSLYLDSVNVFFFSFNSNLFLFDFTSLPSLFLLCPPSNLINSNLSMCFPVHTRLNITIASESLFKHIIFASSLFILFHSIPQRPLLAHNRIVISEIERDKNVNVYSIYKYTYTNSTHDCITYLLNLFAKWNEIGAAKEINRDSLLLLLSVTKYPSQYAHFSSFPPSLIL